MTVSLKPVFGDTAIILRREWPALLALGTVSLLVLDATYLPVLLPPVEHAPRLPANVELALLVALLVAQSVIYAAVTALALGRVSGRPRSAGASLRAILRAVPAIIAVQLVVTLPKFIQPFVRGGAFGAGTPMNILIGASALLVVVVYAALAGIFIPVLIAERLGLVGSLVRAFRLLRGARATFTLGWVVVLLLDALPGLLLRVPLVWAAIYGALAQFGAQAVYEVVFQATFMVFALVQVAYGAFIVAFYWQRTLSIPSRAATVDTFA